MVYSEIKLEEAAVLHYTYAKFNDLTSRRDRCGCKPTKDDVKRCFMLEFDRAVSFIHYACILIRVYNICNSLYGLTSMLKLLWLIYSYIF